MRTKLHFRNEDDAWRIFAISATYPDGEKSINFEAAVVATAGGGGPLQSLLGKPITLAGYTLDGKPLDMSKCAGKVVLIDFWATRCGPCRAEIPNIFENWKKHHGSGFEVVAISVDQDLEALQAFVAQEQPPWAVVADRHPQEHAVDGRNVRHPRHPRVHPGRPRWQGGRRQLPRPEMGAGSGEAAGGTRVSLACLKLPLG